MGADPSGLALGAVAVCAAAVPDHTLLQVKRHDPNWFEAARLWVGLIGNPSTKKTPIILRATKSLKRLDAEMWRDYLAAKEGYDSLSNEERKPPNTPHRDVYGSKTPRSKQRKKCSSTVRTACLYPRRAIGLVWRDGQICRASRRGQGPWILAASLPRRPLRLNRIARGAGLIENLSISLLGGIQPEPIRKIAEDTLDDGLLQRLIPIVLRRGTAGKDVPTAHAIGQCYDDLIEQLHGREPPPAPFLFTDDALAIRAELEQRHLDLMAYEATNKKLAAHIGKYDGLFARLCLLWHCIEG